MISGKTIISNNLTLSMANQPSLSFPKNEKRSSLTSLMFRVLTFFAIYLNKHRVTRISVPRSWNFSKLNPICMLHVLFFAKLWTFKVSNSSHFEFMEFLTLGHLRSKWKIWPRFIREKKCYHDHSFCWTWNNRATLFINIQHFSKRLSIYYVKMHFWQY